MWQDVANDLIHSPQLRQTEEYSWTSQGRLNNHLVNIIYNSGSQHGVRVPPGVPEKSQGVRHIFHLLYCYSNLSFFHK